MTDKDIQPHLFRLSAPFLAVIFFLLAITSFAWVFQDILLPFVLGAVIAYILNPIVDYLDQKHPLKRHWTVIFILSIFAAVFGGLMAILLPIAAREAIQLAGDLPELLKQLGELIDPYVSSARELLQINSQQQLEDVLISQSKQALKAGGIIGQTLGQIGQSVTAAITTPIITAIIAFFMMSEWPLMSDWVKNMVPRPYIATATKLWHEINTKLSGFIRGQFTVAFMLGVCYAVALAIAGLNYGILIGIMSGVLSLIPFIGSTIGLLTSVGVAYLQTQDMVYVGIIASIFLVGQLIEGNFLTPKIVGDKVGLHPLWVFFALLAGGALMGIAGILIAVPIAAVISVLLGFAIERYKASRYYKGDDATE